MADERKVVRSVIFEYVRGRLETPSTAITQYVELVSAAIEQAASVSPEEERFDAMREPTNRIDRSNKELAEALVEIGNFDDDESDEEIQAQDTALTKEKIRGLLNIVRGSADLIRRSALKVSGGGKIAPAAELIVTEADRALEVIGILTDPGRFLDLEWTIRQDLDLAPPDRNERIDLGRVLVIDSDPTMRDLTCKIVEGFGCDPHPVASGEEGITMLRRTTWNLVLLDLVLDDMTGFKVLEFLSDRGDDTPVIVVTSVQQHELLGASIRMGARDFLQKPPSRTLLKARIGSLFQRKQVKDRTQDLVHSILPRDIATRWKGMASGGLIADRYDHAAILFSDLCGFTQMSAKLQPKRLVLILNEVFDLIDKLIADHGVEKIKTIGDAYMIASGLPNSAPDARAAVAPLAELALRLPDEIEKARRRLRMPKDGLRIRIGIHVGPAVAGVIGDRTIAYDVWGDTVNVASRMESHGEPGRVHVSEAVKQAVAGDYVFEDREPMEIKGLGLMRTHFLTHKR